MRTAHLRGSNLPHPQLLNQALQNLLLPVSTSGSGSHAPSAARPRLDVKGLLELLKALCDLGALEQECRGALGRRGLWGRSSPGVAWRGRCPT